MICGVFKDKFVSIKNHNKQHTKADVVNMLILKIPINVVSGMHVWNQVVR